MRVNVDKARRDRAAGGIKGQGMRIGLAQVRADSDYRVIRESDIGIEAWRA